MKIEQLWLVSLSISWRLACNSFGWPFPAQQSSLWCHWKDAITGWVNIPNVENRHSASSLMWDKNSYLCVPITSWISGSSSKKEIISRWAPVTWLHQQRTTHFICFFAAMPGDIWLWLVISHIAHRQVLCSQWPDPLVRTPPSTPGHDCLGSCQMGKSSMEIFTRCNSAKEQAVLQNQHGFGDTVLLRSKRHGSIWGAPAAADSGFTCPAMATVVWV